MNKLFIEYKVSLCSRNEVKDFIEKWHYSKSINGVISDYCFKMEYNGKIIGAILFGRLAMANQWKKYSNKSEDIIELRRLVCINETKKNAESFLIGRSLRWIKNNTNIKAVVSYADPEYGHSGVIYQATNFKLVGQSSQGKVIFWKGKKYHDKTIRTFYKGKLKPFAQKVKDALFTGEAVYKKTKGKNIYLYTFT